VKFEFLLNSILKCFIITYIVSLIFSQYFFFYIYSLKISLTEIIFPPLFFCLVVYSIFYYKKIRLKTSNTSNFIDTSLLVILIFKIIKLYLNDLNLYNYKEIIEYVYLIIIYFSFRFIFDNFNKIDKIIYKSFEIVFIFSSIIILFSVIIYYFISQENIFNLWIFDETKLNPVYGKNLHFTGFFETWNMQAYVIIPGLFIILCNRKINKISFYLVSFIGGICLYFLKTKILVLLFFYLIYNFIVKKFKSKFFSKKISFIFFFISIFIIYSLLTHFIVLNKGSINSSNQHLYEFYLTKEPIKSILNYEIYGSVLYKLKLIMLQISSDNNYLYFQGEYFEKLTKNIFFEDPSMKNMMKSTFGMEPHSLIFGSLINYGIFGLIFYLIFYFNPILISTIENNENGFLTEKNVVLIVLSFFLVVSINSDVQSLRFLMIFYALFIREYLSRKNYSI